MWRYIASTSVISWGVGFFAAAAIQRRPRWDVYHVLPSTLQRHTSKQNNAMSWWCSGFTPSTLKVFFFLPMFTSSCLRPAATPTAGACWGTSHHQTSPAALCLESVNWRAPLCLCPLLNSSPSLSSWSFLCHLHPPTRKKKQEQVQRGDRECTSQTQTGVIIIYINILIYLWCRLCDVGVHQLSTPQCPTHLPFRGFGWIWCRFTVHRLQCFIHSARDIWYSAYTLHESTALVEVSLSHFL